MNKIYPDAAAAIEGVTFDGMTIMAGGSACAAFPRT